MIYGNYELSIVPIYFESSFSIIKKAFLSYCMDLRKNLIKIPNEKYKKILIGLIK